MGESPIYHLPWPELSDPADVPAAMQDTALATDGILNTFHTETQADLDDMQGQITGATGSVVKLGHVSLAADAASIDFAAIPQIYSHLFVMGALRAAAVVTVTTLRLRLNQLSTTAYYSGALLSNNSAASGPAALGTTGWDAGVIPGGSAAAGSFGPCFLVIPDYADASHNRGFVGLSFANSATTAAGQWLKNAGGFVTVNAVTHVSVYADSGNLKAGSKLTLYGLKGA